MLRHETIIFQLTLDWSCGPVLLWLVLLPSTQIFGQIGLVQLLDVNSGQVLVHGVQADLTGLAGDDRSRRAFRHPSVVGDFQLIEGYGFLAGPDGTGGRAVRVDERVGLGLGLPGARHHPLGTGKE